MADVSKTVEIIFSGDDQFTKVAKGIEKSMGGIVDVSEDLANVANTVLAVEAAIIGMGAAIAVVAEESKQAGKQFQAALGIPVEKAEELEAATKELFAAGFAENITEAAGVVEEAFRKFGDVGEEELTRISTNAKSIEDIFGEEYARTLAAAQTLTQNFGLTIDESFDFIASGFQKGLNVSEDFIDSINEYSTQFSNGGADAGQFFSVLETGLQNGMLGTDKAADMFKEFRVRILDGSTATADALNMLGLNTQEVLAGLSSGTMTTADAFDLVLEALRGTSDQATVMQAGVGLLGTQFEDLGQTAALAIDGTQTKMEDLAGATESLATKYDTLTEAIKTSFRRVVVELSELEIWQEFGEKAKEYFNEIAAALPEAFANVDFSQLSGALDSLQEAVQGLFGGLDFTSADDLTEIIQTVVDAVSSLTKVTAGIIETWEPFVQLIIKSVEWLGSLSEETAKAAGNILGLAQQITLIVAPIAGIAGAVASAKVALAGLGAGATAAIGAGAAGAGAVGLVGLAGAAGAATGTLLRMIPGVDEAAQAVIGFGFDVSENLVGGFSLADEAIAGTIDRIEDFNEAKFNPKEIIIEPSLAYDEIDNIDIALQEFFDDVEKGPEGISLDEFKAGIDEILVLNDTASGEISVKAQVDEQSVEYARGYIEETLPDGTRYIEWVGEVAEGSLKTAADTVNAIIPAEKKLEIKTKLDIARLQAESNNIDAMLKYKAEVDTAEAEASAEILKAAFATVGTGITEASDNIGALLDNMAGLGSGLEETRKRWAIEEQLEKENALREDQLRLQQEMSAAQIAYMEAKAQAMTSGQALINVTMDGRYEPALEFMADEFIRHVQIKADEEGMESLLGI